jgi:hypothetical protein
MTYLIQGLVQLYAWDVPGVPSRVLATARLAMPVPDCIACMVAPA